MLGRITQYLRDHARRRKLDRYAIPDALWERTVAGLPFVQRYPADDMARLRELATLFIAQKEYSTAHDLPLTDDMVVSIAVQASVPVLSLGIEWYRGWHGIVLYPGEFIIRKTVEDEIGLVHGVVEEASGEAWERGPVILSWPDASQPGTGIGHRYGTETAPDASGDTFNVVIHEFAHKLDMLNGEADGVPPFSRSLHRDVDSARWAEDFLDAYDRFADACEAVPDEAWEYSDALPPALRIIDPYGTEAPAEFFAVSSESFFVDPLALRMHWPDVYRLLAAFYRQDPAELSS